MTAANRWGATKRTKADLRMDCVRFCATARIEAVRALSDEEIASRYGVDRKFATYHRTMRLQKEPVA